MRLGSHLITLIVSYGLITACGSADAEFAPRKVAADAGTSTTTTPSTCTELLKTQDTDGDGLTDFDEFYGREVEAGNNGMVMIFSDPRNADTDGDGVSDADGFQVLNKNSSGKDVFLHPGLRDFALEVHAKGGDNGTEVATGWNIYKDPALMVHAGDKVFIKDLGLSTWRIQSSRGPFNAQGDSANMSGCETNSHKECINSYPKAALIGKYSTVNDEDDNFSNDTIPFKIGKELNADLEGSFIVPNDVDGQFLFLRANDEGQGTGHSSYNDNVGSIQIYLSVSNEDDYPHDHTPLGIFAQEILDELCGGNF